MRSSQPSRQDPQVSPRPCLAQRSPFVSHRAIRPALMSYEGLKGCASYQGSVLSSNPKISLLFPSSDSSTKVSNIRQNSCLVDDPIVFPDLTSTL